jgi:hypothetical protein
MLVTGETLHHAPALVLSLILVAWQNCWLRCVYTLHTSQIAVAYVAVQEIYLMRLYNSYPQWSDTLLEQAQDIEKL